MLTEDIYNRLLQSAGELALLENEVLEHHPMYRQIQLALRSTVQSTQATGWWFNKFCWYGTNADVSGIQQSPFGATPLAVLSVDGEVAYGYEKLIYIGEHADSSVSPFFMYARSRQRVGDDTQIKATVIQEWPFDMLPFTMKEYALTQACLSLAKAYDADQIKLATLQQESQQAYVALHAEHVRQSNVNMLETRSMSNKMFNSMQTMRYR